MRVFIEQDMEGVAGVFDWASALSKAGKLDVATKFMTEEVNAAVAGALAAGAGEVVALEAHEFDRAGLHPAARLCCQPLFEVKGPGDALFFVGRHAMSQVADGILNHTGSSRSIREVRVNGRPFGEMGLVAAWFGSQGVPTALVTGDEAACREAKEFFGVVETVAVKKGTGCHTGVSLSPEEARRAIRAGAERALRRLKEFKPFVVSGPVVLEVEYRHSEVVDWICRVPGLTRVNACTTRFESPDYEGALRMYYAQGAMLWRYDAV